LIFGPKKLPELGKALGDGIRGFKDGVSPSAKSEDTKTKESAETPQAK
jgi:sec-independent protein translocase protein TatA